MWCSVGKPLYVSKGYYNQYCLIKDGRSFNIIAHKSKTKLSLIRAHQTKRLINSSMKYVFLSLRQNQQ